MNDITDVADILLYAGAAGVVYFTIRYGTASKWWRYAEGIGIFLKSLSLAVISLFVASTLLFGEYPGRLVVRVCAYGFFFVCAWLLVVVYERRRGIDRHHRRELVDALLAAQAREADEVRTPPFAELDEVPVPVRIVRKPRRPLWGFWRRWRQVRQD